MKVGDLVLITGNTQGSINSIIDGPRPVVGVINYIFKEARNKLQVKILNETYPKPYTVCFKNQVKIITPEWFEKNIVDFL